MCLFIYFPYPSAISSLSLLVLIKYLSHPAPTLPKVSPHISISSSIIPLSFPTDITLSLTTFTLKLPASASASSPCAIQDVKPPSPKIAGIRRHPRERAGFSRRAASRARKVGFTEMLGTENVHLGT